MPRGLISHFEIKCIAKHDIHYRYQCENCGATTEWTKATITQKASKIQKFGGYRGIEKSGNDELRLSEHRILSAPDMQLQVDAVAKKRIDNVILLFRKILSSDMSEIIIENEPFIVSLYNDIFCSGKSCPTCGYKQSWYPAISNIISTRKSIKNFTLLFCAMSLVLSSIICAIALKTVLSIFLGISFTVIIAGFIGGVCGYAQAKYLLNKKSKHIGDIHNIRKPEVDWNLEKEYELTS